MKIRKDFVTNSSSSSFVMGFKNEATMLEEATEGMPKFGKYRLDILLSDLEGAEKLTREQVKEQIREGVYWGEWMHHVYEECFTKPRSYQDTDECKQIVEKKTEKRMAEIEKKSEQDTVFAIIEYDDHTLDDMEHEIMPRHKNTVYVINNH